MSSSMLSLICVLFTVVSVVRGHTGRSSPDHIPGTSHLPSCLSSLRQQQRKWSTGEGSIIKAENVSIVTWCLREVTQTLHLPSDAKTLDNSLPGALFVLQKISSWIAGAGLELGRKEDVKWQ